MKTIACVIAIFVSIIAVAVSIRGIIFCDRFVKKCDRVYDFRCMIIDMSSRFNKRHNIDSDSNSAFKWFYGKWNYVDMLYSNRPLTLEEWYTPEELERIES